MLRYQVKNYYSLEEILEETPYTTGNDTLKTILDNLSLVNDLASSQEVAEDLWSLLYGRFFHNYCIVSDNDTLDSNEVKLFFIRFLNIYNMTKQKYRTILKIYKDNMNNMLAKIETSSNGDSRFNDTPQESGDFSDDSHTTSITQNSNTTLTDGDTIMGRIKDIQSSYDNVLANWCNEFAKLFINVSEVY